MKPWLALCLSPFLFLSLVSSASPIPGENENSLNDPGGLIEATLQMYDIYICNDASTGNFYNVQFKRHNRSESSSSTEDASGVLAELEGIMDARCEVDSALQDQNPGEQKDHPLYDKVIMTEAGRLVSKAALEQQENGQGLWRYSASLDRMVAIVPIAANGVLKGKTAVQLAIFSIPIGYFVTYFNPFLGYFIMVEPLSSWLFVTYCMKDFTKAFDSYGSSFTSALQKKAPYDFVYSMVSFLGYEIHKVATSSKKS